MMDQCSYCNCLYPKNNIRGVCPKCIPRFGTQNLIDLSRPLDDFLGERCCVIPGEQTLFSDFISEFQHWNGTCWLWGDIFQEVMILIRSKYAWRNVILSYGSKSYLALGNLSIPTHKYIERDNKLLRVSI